MTVLLTILGVFLLVPSVAGVILGVFMAFDASIRRAGLFFVLWWVPGIVASLGVLIRDPATFLMGLVCFVVAGLALLLEERWASKPSATRRRAPTADSERTTRQNKIREQDEDAIKEHSEGAS